MASEREKRLLSRMESWLEGTMVPVREEADRPAELLSEEVAGWAC